MAKAVLTTKVISDYDDLPEVRYHFPKTYLSQASQAEGDWIVYYEPRRPSGEANSTGGRQAYFATARIEKIYPDPARADHFYAEISNYLPFTNPVPFKEGERYYESALRKDDGSTNKGAFGRAVRVLPTEEFDLIWQVGFGHALGTAERQREAPDRSEEPMPKLEWLAEDKATYDANIPFHQDRKIIEQLVSRPFRDRAFSAAVKNAYQDTCAITGLKIINGGGRSEVQAAHIKPVEHHGPDSVRNGIALSGTVHWMFDRGLISIDEDYNLLFAKNLVPDAAERLLGGNKKLLLPRQTDVWPHPKFLEYHRQMIFKG